MIGVIYFVSYESSTSFSLCVQVGQREREIEIDQALLISEKVKHRLIPIL